MDGVVVIVIIGPEIERVGGLPTRITIETIGVIALAKVKLGLPTLTILNIIRCEGIIAIHFLI